MDIWVILIDIFDIWDILQILPLRNVRLFRRIHRVFIGFGVGPNEGIGAVGIFFGKGTSHLISAVFSVHAMSVPCHMSTSFTEWPDHGQLHSREKGHIPSHQGLKVGVWSNMSNQPSGATPHPVFGRFSRFFDKTYIFDCSPL